MSWIQLQQNLMSRFKWSNIIFHEHTSNIFCNHFTCLWHWHNTQSVSVTLNVSTSVTLQNNTLQSIEPFTIHVSENHICSHSLDWIQMSVKHWNIGLVNTPFHLWRRFRGSSVFNWNVCCMYVGLIALLINKLISQLYENKKKNWLFTTKIIIIPFFKKKNWIKKFVLGFPKFL